MQSFFEKMKPKMKKEYQSNFEIFGQVAQTFV